MWRAEFIGRRLWLWFIYIAVVSAVVLIHYRGEVFDRDCDTLTWTAKLWHQRLCTAGHRKPRAHYVRVITLTAGKEPVADKCEGRKFIASLLLRLRDLDPSLIVIDKWYLPNGCATPDATATLQNNVSLVSQTIPVILAQDSYTYEELLSNNDPNLSLWEELHLGKNGEVLAESAIHVDGKASHLGVARLACNTWRIPLRWMVYPPLHDVDAKNNKEIKETQVDTLALAAATKFDSHLGEVIDGHAQHHDGLVSAFLGLDAFQPLSATQVLCGVQTTIYDPSTCNPAHNDELSLKGKIIVIGEYSENDRHKSVIGTVPGFLLQANYIESLLDDRYYQLIPRWLEIMLVVLCFVLVDITVERARSPHLGALWALAGVVALWGIAHFAIMEWGYYFTFWFPTVLAVLAKWLESLNKIPRRLGLANPVSVG